jgi:integrase
LPFRFAVAFVALAAGTNILSVSRRLGHGSPAITLTVYGHLFDNSDEKAAAAIEAVLKRG